MAHDPTRLSSRCAVVAIVATAIILLGYTPSHAIDITETFESTFDDIAPGEGAAARATVRAAVSWWEQSLGGPHVIPITFNSAALGAGGPKASTFWGIDAAGCPAAATITFNTDIAWFVDPTPHIDEEFDAQGVARPGGGAVGLCDLRTVAKHEICHALGFEAQAAVAGGGIGFPLFNACVNAAGAWTCPPPAGAVMVGGVGLGNRSHLDPAVAGQANDLMQPALPFGVRRDISLRNVQMLVSAFGAACGYTNTFTDGAYRIPAASDIGLVVLLLMTAVAGVIVIRRTRRGHAAG